MRRRGRKRRSLVRWLPDNSWFSQISFKRESGLAVGTPRVGSLNFDLIEAAESTAMMAGTGAGAATRKDDDSLIIDHVSGRFHFGIIGNGGNGGDVDASGDAVVGWGIVIWTRPMNSEPGGAGYLGIGTGSTQFDGTMFEPSNVSQMATVGSYTPDGVRVLFRRSFVQNVFFQQDLQDFCPNSEGCVPPANYIDIKPKRLLRAGDRLTATVVYDIIPQSGWDNTGTVRVYATPDLRVAAHNTTRRR